MMTNRLNGRLRLERLQRNCGWILPKWQTKTSHQRISGASTCSMSYLDMIKANNLVRLPDCGKLDLGHFSVFL